MATAKPNPYSPFADADPGTRHLFAVPVFFLEAVPRHGELLPTGCSRLAVVPDDVRETTMAAELPDGLCSMCVAAMRTGAPLEDSRSVTVCRECGAPTRHDGLCAFCRRRMHEQWWSEHAVGGSRP